MDETADSHRTMSPGLQIAVNLFTGNLTLNFMLLTSKSLIL